MRAFGLRVREDAAGHYAHLRGEVLGATPFPSHEDAETVRRAMPNGAEFEVVEVDQ